MDACRGLVDELAISPTIANGKEEMMRCEQVFRQVCWLAERFWPDVDGMGEEDDTGRGMSLAAQGGTNGAVQAARAATEVAAQESTFTLGAQDASTGSSS